MSQCYLRAATVGFLFLVSAPIPASAQPVSGAEQASAGLWDIDIAGHGPQCIVEPEKIRLWRAISASSATLRVAGPANFPYASIDFPAGSSSVPLEASVFPVTDGSRMIVTDTSSGATIGSVDFVFLTAAPKDNAALISALSEAKCMLQLGRLKN